MAGRLQNQNRKKLRKSRVFVLELAGKPLGRFSNSGQMARIMSFTQFPIRAISGQAPGSASQDMLTPNPRLDTIPDTSHRSSIKDRP